jgi:CubicO group peptidase (beta-lactamase class C family)
MHRTLARSCSRVALATALLLGAGCSSRARAPATAARAPTAPLTVPAATLASWIDGYASGFGKEWGRAFAPTGYLVVAKDGVPIVSRAYGTANPKTGAAIGPSTQLALGSVTKQFTAVAVLQLAEKKRVNLTDSIRSYVTGLPPEFDGVTLHHLLTQTSGVASYTADPELMASTDVHLPRARVVASFAQKPLAFRPGTKFDYSNSNYFLLGLVIEKASGKTFEEYLQASVLGPANMLRSTTAFDAHTFDAALGTSVDNHEKIVPVRVWDTPFPFAAGALRSTAIDMIAWDRALGSGKLLSAESEARRTTVGFDGYACGVLVGEQNGHRVEWHNGGIDGFSSFFARVPDLGVAIAFLSNSDGFDATSFGRAVTKMIVEAKPVPPKAERRIGILDAALASNLEGTYDLAPASREKLVHQLPATVLDTIAKMTITADGSRIVVKANGQPPFFAYPDGAPNGDARAFFTKTQGVELFPKVDPGTTTVRGFRIEQHGLVIDYARATPGT